MQSPPGSAAELWPGLYWGGLALVGVYLICWLGLLVHCLRKRRFYPVFGHGWGTKAFWLFTFLLVHPLLLLWYLLFGVIASADRRPSLGRTLVVAAPAVCFAALWLVPFVLPGPDTAAVVTTRDPTTGEMAVPPTAGVYMNLGSNESRRNLEHTSSSSHSPAYRVAAETVEIRVEGEDPLLLHAAAALHRDLASVPYLKAIRRVGLNEAREQVEARNADVYVTLRLAELEDDYLPLRRHMRGGGCTHLFAHDFRRRARRVEAVQRFLKGLGAFPIPNHKRWHRRCRISWPAIPM